MASKYGRLFWLIHNLLWGLDYAIYYVTLKRHYPELGWKWYWRGYVKRGKA